jgi:hypothetical protein
VARVVTSVHRWWKQTSAKAGSAASEVLRDDDSTAKDKQAAGSALSQTPTRSTTKK